MPLLQPGAVLLLSGDLGAGKTAFVKGLAEGLGISSDEVTSPTFTLVHDIAADACRSFMLICIASNARISMRLASIRTWPIGGDCRRVGGADVAAIPGRAVTISDRGDDRREIDVDRPHQLDIELLFL